MPCYVIFSRLVSCFGCIMSCPVILWCHVTSGHVSRVMSRGRSPHIASFFLCSRMSCHRSAMSLVPVTLCLVVFSRVMSCRVVDVQEVAFCLCLRSGFGFMGSLRFVCYFSLPRSISSAGQLSKSSPAARSCDSVLQGSCSLF